MYQSTIIVREHKKMNMTEDNTIDNTRMKDQSTNNTCTDIAAQQQQQQQQQQLAVLDNNDTNEINNVVANDDNSIDIDNVNYQTTKFIISSINDYVTNKSKQLDTNNDTDKNNNNHKNNNKNKTTIDSSANNTNSNLLLPVLSINVKQYCILHYKTQNNQQQLTKLILNNNIYLGDYGITLISYILLYNNTIQELNLDTTIGITDNGIKFLSNSLQYHPSITNFSFIVNPKNNQQLSCIGIYYLLKNILEYNETIVSIAFDNVLSIDNYYYIMKIHNNSNHFTMYNNSLNSIQLRYSNSCTPSNSTITIDIQKQRQIQLQVQRMKQLDDNNTSSNNEIITSPKIGTRRRYDMFTTLLHTNLFW